MLLLSSKQYKFFIVIIFSVDIKDFIKSDIRFEFCLIVSVLLIIAPDWFQIIKIETLLKYCLYFYLSENTDFL